MISGQIKDFCSKVLNAAIDVYRPNSKRKFGEAYYIEKVIDYRIPREKSENDLIEAAEQKVVEIMSNLEQEDDVNALLKFGYRFKSINRDISDPQYTAFFKMVFGKPFVLTTFLDEKDNSFAQDLIDQLISLMQVANDTGLSEEQQKSKVKVVEISEKIIEQMNEMKSTQKFYEDFAAANQDVLNDPKFHQEVAEEAKKQEGQSAQASSATTLTSGNPEQNL